MISTDIRSYREPIRVNFSPRMGSFFAEVFMHIPDGYLSPQTALPVLAGMIPVWAVAFRKVKLRLGERRIPSLAMGAAFSFLIMMFNIPVAGGSSAHAVGAVLVAILLGPWAATVSVSAALLIQALAFGDGGILNFGVNCFNMAFIMPFAGYGVYRLLRGRAAPDGRRGVLAAALGAYTGLNLAAFAAAVELGIQPIFFHAANGAALYCPYPLAVSIPAMMLAHGLFAGPLEAALTAAAAAYLAKAAPSVFSQGRPALSKDPNGRSVSLWKRTRVFWIPLAVLAALTPLGLLASGTAWGEWGAQELRRAVGYVPKGFAALADRWKALFPDYSLPLLGKNATAGYLLSAVAGIALIAGTIFLTAAIASKHDKRKRKT